MSIAIKRNFTIPSTSSIGASEISLSSSTASTSVATGAIISLGGAGISGAISLGGPLKLYNGIYYTGFDSAATANTTYIWPATSPSIGTSVLSSDSAGNLSWVLMSASGSGLTLNNLTSTTQYFSTSISGVGFTISSVGSTHTFNIGLAGNASTGLISSESQTLFGLKSFASGAAITSGTPSTSTSNGSLTVAGGVGIGGSLWTATTNFSSISGVGHSNSVITSGVWSGTAISAVNGGTGLTSYTTGDILYAISSNSLGRIAAGSAGSILTSAGVGITPYWAAALPGSGLTLNGLTTSTQTFATSISGSGFTIGSSTSTHTFYIGLAGNATTGFISSTTQTIFGLKTFGSGLAITSGTGSTSTTTGALTVAGGVGITGQLSVNTIALGTTGVSLTPSMTYVGSAGTVISMSVLSDTTLAWEGSSGQLFSIDNNLSTGEIFSVSDISGLPIITASAGQTITLNEFGGYTQVGNGLASTNTTTGALRVIGGVGVSGNVAVGGTFIRSQWSVGETIQTAVYNYTDLGMSATTTISGTTFARIGGTSFTPRSSSSYLWIEFNANYDFNNGSTVDDFWSNITVNGTEIVASNQIFINASGGGSRSGTLFPLMARYTNSSTSGIAITVQAKRGTADDSIRVYGGIASGYMRIQEIGR